MSPQRLEPVSAAHAYRAAVDRCARVTEALIGAEARLLEVLGKLGRLEEENTQLHQANERLCKRLDEYEGVNGDGQTGEFPPASVGEAVPAHPFSD